MDLYLSLPVAALAARGRRAHLPFTLGGLAATLAWAVWLGDSSASTPICAALFFTGMSCASLRERTSIPLLPDKAASVLVLALVVTVFVACPGVYAASPVVLLGLAFYLIASGCTVFGLLASRAARRLGDVSYGIYLLQGLVLTVVLRPRPLRALSLGSPVQHWASVLLCAMLLTALATAAHAGVEQPGIALGKRAAAAISGAWRLARRPRVVTEPRG